MLKHHMPSGLLILITLSHAMFTSGCTALGLLMGSGIERSGAVCDTVSIARNTELKEASSILVLTKDSTAYFGKFLGWRDDLTPEYQERYRDWRADAGDRLLVPALGDSINIRLVERVGQKIIRLVRRLAGFSSTAVLVNFHESVRQEQDEVQSIDLSRVDSIYYGRGASLSGQAIYSLLSAESIPSTRHLVIGWADWTFIVPWDVVREIKNVTARDSAETNYAGVGFAIGMAIDITIIIVAVNTGGWGWGR